MLQKRKSRYMEFMETIVKRKKYEDDYRDFDGDDNDDG